MTGSEPVGELGAFSSPGATAPPWAQVLKRLQDAEVFWISTVRPDGRPHVTPLLAVWLEDACYFSTGPGERKAENLLANRQCVLTAGRDRFADGLDIVIEGTASKVEAEAELRGVADVFEAKYGPRFTSPEGTWFGLGDSIRAGGVLLYRVDASKILGFGKGEQFSQTRWRFAQG
jgi:hypothetical protein